MFKYNEISNTSQFIQNLLRNSPVPVMPILTDEQYNKLIEKYNKSTEEEKPTFNFHYIYNRNFYEGNSIIGPYEFGKKYPNITDNYIPLQNYYSTTLHEHLGNYLRNYSEYYKINLMGLYNCFSNRLISNISLPLIENPRVSTDETIVRDVWYASEGTRDDCIITCFPIRVEGSYTIRIYGNVRGNVIIQPIFFNGSTFIKMTNKKSSGDSENNNGETKSKAILFPASTYGYANTINYTFDEKIYANENDKNYEHMSYTRLLQNQKYLYLFVQVPVVENLRISVIENTNFFNVVNNTLLHLSDISYNIPFSDRLLEFLVGNVITREDPIKKNITRVQELIETINPNRDGTKFKNYEKNSESLKPDTATIPPYNKIASTDVPYSPVPGLYDDTLRVIIYDYLSNRAIPDFTGYIDKDVEQILTEEATAKTLYSKGTYPFQKTNRG